MSEYVKQHGLATFLERAAALVDMLSLCPPPNAGPGPIGGGCLCHSLFKDRHARREYATLDGLENEMNRVRSLPLRTCCMLISDQVISRTTTEYRVAWSDRNLAVYYSDWEEANFLKADDGRTCVVDYQYAGVVPKDMMAMAFDNPAYEKLAGEVKSRAPNLAQVSEGNMAGQRLATYYHGSGCP